MNLEKESDLSANLVELHNVLHIVDVIKLETEIDILLPTQIISLKTRETRKCFSYIFKFYENFKAYFISSVKTPSFTINSPFMTNL